MIFHEIAELPEHGQVAAFVPSFPGGSIVGRSYGKDEGGPKAYLTEVDEYDLLYFRLGVDPNSIFPRYIEPHPLVPGHFRTTGKAQLLIEPHPHGRLLANPASFYETVALSTLHGAVHSRQLRRQARGVFRGLDFFRPPDAT